MFDEQHIREQVTRHRDLATALGVRRSEVDAWERLERPDREAARAELIALYRGAVEAAARDHITGCAKLTHCTECVAWRSVLAAGLAYDRVWTYAHPRPSWDTATIAMEAPRAR